MLFRDLRSAGALVLLALVLLALGLASCGGGSTTSSKAAAKPATVGAAGTVSKTTISSGVLTTRASTTAPAHPSAHSTVAAHPSGASSAAGRAALNRALGSFAACLSRNGVHLPSAGRSRTAPALTLNGVDTKSPAYRKALAACVSVINAALKAGTKARPGSASSSVGGPATGASPRSPGPSSRSAAPPRLPPGAVPASVTAGYERFTACMRSNGVPGFPEPTGASFDLSGTNLNPKSPQYKAAEKTCDPILMAVDDAG
jgi:hypothetical protein